MQANSTIALEGELLLLNQLELVTPTTVAGTFYGIAFTLFCIYVHALVPRLLDEDRKKQAKFMLAYSAVIMLCGLYNLVSDAWVSQDAYIKHKDYPGGPIIYVATHFHTSAVIGVGLACETAIDILTSAIQIWRVWVIWSATGYARFAIVLPSLCFLTLTALHLRTLILEITLPIAKLVPLDTQTEIAEIAIQGANTILCTTLISLFLVYEHWRQRKLIGKAQGSAGYMKVVTLLIESYALESIWLLVAAALSDPQRTVAAFFSETTTCIEIIAYLLVQYRVASGRAYESQREQSRIGSLHFNHSNHATTQHEMADEACGGPWHVPVKKETSDMLPASSMA